MPDHGPLIGDAGVACDMADVIHATITSEAWRFDDDVHVRVEMLTLALCEALSVRAGRSIPSVAQLRGAMDVRERNAAVKREFDGHNYFALAMRHRLSVRQVRRLLDDPRSERRRK